MEKYRQRRSVAESVASRNYDLGMPVYEFACGDCGERFEELVGSHVGRTEDEVLCPKCGGAKLKRLVAGSYAPLHRRLTPNQKRRLEQRRGTDRGGALQRFNQQRASRRPPGGGRRGG